MHENTKRILQLDTIHQKTPEWYEIRNDLLTASDVPSALGQNPYKSRKQLLKEKCGLTKKVFKGNFATNHGQKYESVALSLYEKRYDDKCYETGLYIHPVYKWLGCSPDGISTSGRLIEIKCPIKRTISDAVPEHYYGQIQIQLECLDIEECLFIQYKPETFDCEEILNVSIVNRDRSWFETNLQSLKQFWEHVLDTRSKTINVT